MENMTDYIAREALLKNFSGIDLTKCVKYGNETKEQRYRSYDTMMMYEIADAIEDAPAADVTPVRYARWVWDDNGMDWGLGAWLCGACFCRNANLPADKNINPYMWAGAKYCPHCGAKIGVGNRENDARDTSSKSERKTAHWIKITGMRPPEYAGRHVCSECGGMALENRMREMLSEYCPHCGAKLGD